MNKKPLVAIVGCGPAGLLSAHACTMRDVPFVIFSPKMKSKLGGAQYSHIPIPGLHDEENSTVLSYRVMGDADTYHRKVYGDQRVPFVSFENVKDGMQVPAWPLVRTYDELWNFYHDKIIDVKIDPTRLDQLTCAFDLVISTAPAPLMCLDTMDAMLGHWFKEQTVYIANECIDPNVPNMTIVYDGTEEHSWYRMSNLFHVGSTEWGVGAPKPPLPDIRVVNKPIATNCDCHLSDELDSAGVNKGVMRIGRFGTWSKGELTYHGYLRVIDVFAKWGLT